MPSRRRVVTVIAVIAGLAGLVMLDLFVRRSLEHSDQHLYSFLEYFYPLGERAVFHTGRPIWRWLLPMPEFTGMWSVSMVITHLTEQWLGPVDTWYLFNALFIVLTFGIAWLAFESLAFSFTFAVCMGFGTHFYHTYAVTGGMASPVFAVAMELLMLCTYQVVIADRRRGIWTAAFVVSLIAGALSYEGWLDFVALIVVVGPVAAIIAARWKPVVVRRALAVTGSYLVVTALYIAVKVNLGFGQHAGSESDLVFNYPALAPMVEDITSNVLTHLYMSVTNFLPAFTLSSTALFELGGDRLVALQSGYHAPYLYLVPMHYLFLWRYAAGGVAVIVGYLLVRLFVKSWHEPARDRIAVLICLLMMVMAGSTHALIKIRPMKTTPSMGYHVLVGVFGAALLISYAVMVVWRDWKSPAAKIGTTAAVWCVIFYGALTRPIMLNHLNAEVGVPGRYPNPMNALRTMLGLPEDKTGDLEGFRLVRYSPPPPPTVLAAAPAAAPPATPPAVAPPAPPADRGFGDVVKRFSLEAPSVLKWDALTGVRFDAATGFGPIDIEGNTAGGYQLVSPPIAAGPQKQVIVKAIGSVERGRICIGAIDQGQQKWLHAPSAPASEFLFETGANKAFRLVITTCAGTTVAPKFRVESITYAILEAGGR